MLCFSYRAIHVTHRSLINIYLFVITIEHVSEHYLFQIVLLLTVVFTGIL
jgi:hypothetical protein